MSSLSHPVPAIVLFISAIPVDDPANFKLPISKCPVMDAMVYCAAHKWGVTLLECDSATRRIVFKITDFDKYYRISNAICSKIRVSETRHHRIKALRTWFVSVPPYSDMNTQPCLIVKEDHFIKLRRVMERIAYVTALPPLPLSVPSSPSLDDMNDY